MLESMNDPPSADQLVERIRVLFGVVPTPLVAHDPPDSPYAIAEDIEVFDIPIPAANVQPVDAAEAAATWLTTPNPSFGGLCPQNLIDGTVAQRAFLAGFLASIEDGAFS